ncbi:MAG: DMT family transporter [Cyanobacteria bacterium]|nr:DMT family transporter [Cyanobacteriota bacterium]
MTALDFLLLLMILIWGSNFSIVKVALRDFPEGPFNAMRLVTAMTVYLAVIFGTSARERLRALTRRDWIELFFLGSVGTFLYQFCFVASVKRTSVANGSLIIGVSPIVIALMSAIAGHERIRPVRWLGIAVAMLGLYFVVGHGVDMSAETFRGDLLMMGGVLCWSIYSVASQPILKRHSPLVVIALTFSFGATLYVLTMTPTLIATDWSAVSGFSWMMMLTSALLALNLSYWIWYTGLQRLGGSRTSVYSYLTPVVAMIVAAIWLSEPVSANQLAGAGAIFAGLLITRFVN